MRDHPFSRNIAQPTGARVESAFGAKVEAQELKAPQSPFGARVASPFAPARAIPAAAAVQTLPGVPGNPAAQAISLTLLLIFLFFAYSRILDYALSSLHIPLIVSTLTLCFALLSGGLFRIFRSLTGIYMLLYLGWMAICVPLAFWKGGSFFYFQEYCKSFLVFVLIVASLRRSRNVLHAGYAIALAMVVVAVLCLTLGITDQFGRLTLVTGMLGNSNDLAQVLLVGIPFWILFGNARKSMSIRPLVSAVVILVMLFLIMKTGSRAVMIGVFTVAGMFFLSVSWMNKLRFAIGGMVGAVILLVAMPGALRDRYATIFSTEDVSSREVASAVASASNRTQLLKRSIAMTLRHPAFGVGPGNFQPASAEAFGNQLGTSWYETHNTMTQISSEMGFPGLFLFSGALFCCFRSVWRLSRWKPAAGQPISPAVADHIHFLNRMGSCLLLSLASLTLTSLFTSIAYQIFFPTLIGLCAALDLTAKEELRALFPNKEPSSSPYAFASAAPNTTGRLRPAI